MAYCNNAVSSWNVITLFIFKAAIIYLVYHIFNNIELVYAHTYFSKLLFPFPFFNSCLEIILKNF